MTNKVQLPQLGRVHVLVLLAMCVAFFCATVRVADHHLPILQNSNEVSNISQSVVVANNGPRPLSLQRPTLPVYLLAGADWMWLKLGQARGVYAPDQSLPLPKMWDLGVGMAHAAPEVVVLNRVVCAAFGAGCVWLIFLLTRTLYGGVRLPLLAAMLASVSGVITKVSIMVRPEIFMCFFVALALLGAARVYRHGRRVDYLMAGFACGLAGSSKYNAALVVLPLVVSHIFSIGESNRRHRWVLWAAMMSVLGFVLGTPYALIEPGRFISDLSFEYAHYQSGHLGRDSGAAWVYLRVLLFQEKWTAVLALVGVLIGLFRLNRPMLVVLALGVPYLIFISMMQVKMDRHITPVVPVVIVCAAYALEHGVAFVLRKTQGFGAVPRGAVWAGVCLPIGFVVITGMRQSQATIDLFTGVNGRDEARVWIEQNIPEGSVIAVESRSPWIDRQLYEVRRIPVSYSTSALWPHSPEWYAENGFDYLVMSSRVQGLYRQNPHRYAGEVEGYMALNGAFEIAGRFQGRMWRIAVLRVPDAYKPQTPPPNPPWYVWAGDKAFHPMAPGDPWPVWVWLGSEPPPLNSKVGLSVTKASLSGWIERGFNQGKLVTLEAYKESNKTKDKTE